MPTCIVILVENFINFMFMHPVFLRSGTYVQTCFLTVQMMSRNRLIYVVLNDHNDDEHPHTGVIMYLWY